MCIESIKILKETIITLDTRSNLVFTDKDGNEHVCSVYFTTGYDREEIFQVNEIIKDGFIRHNRGHLYDVVTNFVKENYRLDTANRGK
jgi:hypothetical protein